MLSSTHCAAPATRAIDTCLLPAVGDSSEATAVLPYAAAVMACACDALNPTDDHDQRSRLIPTDELTWFARAQRWQLSWLTR